MSPPRRPDYLPNLDGLRALAIVLVLLHHAPPLTVPWLATLQANGRYGVAVFFAISGYLIATLLLRERDRTGGLDLARFYARRTVRLFPLYYATLAVYAVLVFGLGKFSAESRALFGEKLGAYVFYYANLVPHASEGPFFFAWSLAAEEQFYLVFGVASRWLSGRVVAAGAAVALACKLGALATLSRDPAAAAVLRVVFSYQEAILLGVLAAYAARTTLGARSIAAAARTLPLAALGVVLTAMLVGADLSDKGSWQAELFYGLSALLVAACAARGPLAVLSWRPAVHVGRVSYGIYLFHMLAIDPLKRVFPSHPVVVLVASTCLVIAAASLSFRYVEAPILRLRDALERRRSAPAREPC
jgi:peptidoglycan/LPS O-acetylase OafA/YrhL